MKIIDLEEKYNGLYFMCLEDWSDEMKEAGDHKELWYNKMKDKGLGVKIAVTEDDKVVGMIQYVPLEYSTAEGDNLYFINCIWVHGYKEGVGDFQKKGIGKRLIKAAEEDVKSKGAKGLVAWGLSIPVFMRASWFKKQGYSNVKSFLKGEECIKKVLGGESPDVVIQDYYLDDCTGIEVMKEVKKHNKKSEFIFLTVNGSLEEAVNTVKLGAFDYILKDKDVTLKKVVDNIEEIETLITLRKKHSVIKQAIILSLFILVIMKGSSQMSSPNSETSSKGSRNLRLPPEEYAI